MEALAATGKPFRYDSQTDLFVEATAGDGDGGSASK
jgi:hypothetical protein